MGYSASLRKYDDEIYVVECAVLIDSISPTEKALKETFTDEGVRRQ